MWHSLLTVQRQQQLEKRAAARQVLCTSLSQSGIRTDAGRTFPNVLSYQDWDAVRQAELQREEARVTLKQQKELNRAALGVARAGRPLPDVDPQIQQALQPFVDACASARAKQEERIRRSSKCGCRTAAHNARGQPAQSHRSERHATDDKR